jgi:hypothetical protein
MDVSGYTADDLEIFRKVLDRAVSEADTDMPVELMARRLFVAARTGERDQDRLLALVLGQEELTSAPRRFYRPSPNFPAYLPASGR